MRALSETETTNLAEAQIRLFNDVVAYGTGVLVARMQTDGRILYSLINHKDYIVEMVADASAPD